MKIRLKSNFLQMLVLSGDTVKIRRM